MAARDLVAWTYTDDNAVTYTSRADAFYTAQAGVGGSTATGATLQRERPRNLKPRAANVYHAASGQANWVTIYDPTAYAALVTGTTEIDIRNGGGDVVTGIVRAKRGERPRGTIKP
jgi:hypothetical protein